MNSISSKSTENLSTMNYASTKERAISLIKEETIKENELFECSEDLMLIPNLDEEIVPNTSALLTTDSFEIFSKVNVNPIFIRELLNIIQVVNFVWIASKNNIDLFHKTLLKLGIMFSYLFRNENNENDGVDYALLTPLPIIIYDFIARNGKNSFKYQIIFILMKISSALKKMIDKLDIFTRKTQFHNFYQISIQKT